MIAAGLVGLINGAVTVYLRIPSFVTTLGTLFFVNGLTLTISRGTPVSPPEDSAFAAFMGEWGYSEIIWTLAIAAVMHVLLRHTRWGLHTIASGANPLGASEAGIQVRRLKLGNFILAALLAGLTGILEGFRITSIDPQAGGNQIMFLAVAAAVIGGTPLAGGSGTIIGGLIGAAVLGILNDGFTLIGINAFTFNMILGAAILGAMIFNIHVGSSRAQGRIVMSEVLEALRGEDIVKRFGAVTALDGVSLTLRQGEILGVLGDNGAGKSTLIKILTGFHQQTSGKLFVGGEETMLRSVDHARSLGIECVYQDLALANSLSIYHNMFLNREIIRRGPFRLLNNRAMRERAAECLEEIGVHVPSVDLPVEQLSGGQRQAIAVARAVNSNARILLLDEPLAAMGAREAGLIIDLILRLKSKGGLSIVMIMHNYAQTLDIADRVMLMQRGRVTYQREAASTSVEELMDIVRREYRAMRTMAR